MMFHERLLVAAVSVGNARVNGPFASNATGARFARPGFFVTVE